MVELNGTLADIGLPSIVRLLGELRETGLLRITSGDWTAELAFDSGELISATFGQERGLDALSAAVLMLGNGDFAFVEASPSMPPNIALSPDELSRRLDELTENQNGQAPLVPSLDAVPRLESEAISSADQVVLGRSALQVLLHVDGQRTVRTIIGDGPLVPALRNLALLVQQGLITIESPSRPPPPTPRARPASPPAPPVPVQMAPPQQVAPPEDGILGVCPRLGFADDPARHYPRPTALHRCYASGLPSLVTSQEQRELCLGGRYQSCPRFTVDAADEPRPAEAPSARVVPPGVSARLAVARNMTVADAADEEVPSWIGSDDEPPSGRRAVLGRVRRLRREPLFIAAGAVLGLLIILGSLVALPLLQPHLGPSTPTATPAFTAVSTTAPVRTTPALAADTPAATAASIARPTSAPTAPPRLPPTPTSAQQSGAALLDARFAAGAPTDWLDNPPFAGWRDGAYRLFARQATRFVAVAAPIHTPDDVLVSATMRKTGGPPGGGYGVIVRNQTAEALNGTSQTFDAYVLETGDLGEFGVWRRDGEHWVDLVPWMRSPAVRQGGSPNEITVRVIGTQLLLTINGIEVARVDDDVLAHGGVGVFAGGDNNEVALDRFIVQVPN